MTRHEGANGGADVFRLSSSTWLGLVTLTIAVVGTIVGNSVYWTNRVAVVESSSTHNAESITLLRDDTRENRADIKSLTQLMTQLVNIQSNKK